jgi:hypothetical protein
MLWLMRSQRKQLRCKFKKIKDRKESRKSGTSRNSFPAAENEERQTRELSQPGKEDSALLFKSRVVKVVRHITPTGTPCKHSFEKYSLRD